MILLVYFAIGFIATLLGALVGLGGGVIIKPSLDAVSDLSANSISILSSVTVFSMTCMALATNLKKGIRLTRELVYLALGAVVGGYLGKLVFNWALVLIANDQLMKGSQSLALTLLMVAILFLNNIKRHGDMIESPFYLSLLGLGLGMISSFLGIGGGPLNVAFLMLFCGMDRKYATFGSVFLIFASQGTKLVGITAANEWVSVSLPMVLVLVIGGLSGGYMGSGLYRHMNQKHLAKVFNYAIIAIIFLNAYNAYHFLL